MSRPHLLLTGRIAGLLRFAGLLALALPSAATAQSAGHGRDHRALDRPVRAGGATQSGVDAVLADGGTISGKVGDQAGAPLAGVCVTATATATGAVAQAGQTGADGTYAIDRLAAGSYWVRFTPCRGGNHLAVSYNQQRDEAQAAPVAVTAGQGVTGIDARLPAGATISGRLTDQAGGAPVAEACVAAQAVAPGIPTPGSATPLTYVKTGADGTYTLAGLATGAYRVSFTPFRVLVTDVVITPDCMSAVNYFGAFFRDAQTAETAAPVAVVEGAGVTGIDQQLARAGSISGVLTDRQGHPIDVCVRLTSGVAGTQNPQRTGADGRYAFLQLVAGPYDLEFGGAGRTFTPPLSVPCRQDKYAPATRKAVAVGAGQDVGGVDAALSPRATTTLGLNVSVRTRRPRVALTLTGRLIGLDAAKACRPGAAIVLKIKAGPRTVTTRKAKLNGKCRYTLRLSLSRPLVGWRTRRLTVQARFAGNAVAKPDASRSVRVRV